MKPFNASEFISNQETPVVDKSGEKVEIISTKARGDYSVLGYSGSGNLLLRWDSLGHYYAESPLHDDRNLFFSPKVEVVHIFKHKVMGNKIGVIKGSGLEFSAGTAYEAVGTITGPIVPPEKESGVEK